jgi:peptide/nickel transport system substrate-binding protein
MDYMRKIVFKTILCGLILLPSYAFALPVDVPRKDVFVADQIFRYSVIDNFNFWINGPHTPHRHALFMETLWIRDQETGELVLDVASTQPEYNSDFTTLDVGLRKGLYWSDGVPFSVEDLIYTVETIKGNSKLNTGGWSTQLNSFLDSIEKTGNNSVRFNLKKPNPRFHVLFEARWNGIYMMPKHIFEKVEDHATFKFNPPVTLGAYTVTKTDPQGFWELLSRRDDWKRTPAGQYVNNPGPKHVLTIFYGDSAKKAIAMSRGELDVYFDVDYEAFETTLATAPKARSWYKEFPWAYPNEVSSRQFQINMESDPIYKNKDVRWALALALDIVDIQTTYIGGVAKVTPVPIPPTASLVKLYLDPLEDWFRNLEIEIEAGNMYKPYDPNVPDKIAAWAEKEGYKVPGTPRQVFGTGWWKYDTKVAERLLIKNGFRRDNNGKWLKPNGDLWKIDLQSPPDENDAFRMANAANDMWSDFGITVNLSGLERSVWDQNRRMGEYDISTPWSSHALASGDAWPNVRRLHADFYVPKGESSNSKGGDDRGRLRDYKLSMLIDEMEDLNPNSEENYEKTREFIKYWAENMFEITGIAFKKFVTWDERYWTGFSTSENPNYMPLYWFQGGKSVFQSLKPAN